MTGMMTFPLFACVCSQNSPATTSHLDWRLSQAFPPLDPAAVERAFNRLANVVTNDRPATSQGRRCDDPPLSGKSGQLARGLLHDGGLPIAMPTPPVSDPVLPARSALGRRPSITRDDLIAAALALLGPNRSVSTLGLREVAREARIAPNGFYRHFRDIDELAVTLIELAGASLRTVIGQARQRAATGRSGVRGSVEAFFEKLRGDDRLLHLLLREGLVGSDAFKQAVDRQLLYFEDELRVDLIRLADLTGVPLHEPALVARAITRLVFAVGGSAMDLPRERDPQLIGELTTMVKMIVNGARAMHATP